MVLDFTKKIQDKAETPQKSIVRQPESQKFLKTPPNPPLHLKKTLSALEGISFAISCAVNQFKLFIQDYEEQEKRK